MPRCFPRRPACLFAAVALAAAFFPAPLSASEGGALALDGAGLSLAWAVPFAGMLMSIALFPLFAPSFWERNYGKASAAWAFAFLIPSFLILGPGVTMYSALHTIVGEYVPFIIVLLALFTIAGGIRVTGALRGTPAVNLGILACGTVLASLMGTTGAAMLLIRPLLRAISSRRHKVHSVVFFIFLVANAGGCLTPLGDPPLFLGFLKGVDFFWTLRHLWPQTLFLTASLLALHFVIDLALWRREKAAGAPSGQAGSAAGAEKPGLQGKRNFLLLAGVVGLVLYSGSAGGGEIVFWEDVGYRHANLARDLGLLALAAVSLLITPKESRRGNHFTWAPILEVAKLFAGIFITMIPAIAILRAGTGGALGSLVSLVTAPDGSPVNAAYFWLTGALSSFLDNAPTYLVFFNSAGGDAARLMSEFPGTLAAISCGAVFLGANTYIGNAPNFMVRSIAEERGVKMPSFFGYMAWSVGILVPLFIVMTFVFF
ncbi:MAG: sodium:proton antiporter [Deltaproteobacteria bacterium]|jgi:Na+/H+ antiporter NhaD/arsenite permease-like protein|nr:sodium:proton antiporter [Deltaproteobacteria bacterium]